MTGTDSRAVLAANLSRMIEAQTPRGARPAIRAWAMSKGLDVRLITRLGNKKNAVNLDTLQELADALGLEPWHLLLPNLEPGSTPAPPITPAERKLLSRLRDILDK